MLTSAEQIEAIIKDCFKFELFCKDEECFWSNRVLTNIGKQEEIAQKRSIAGRAGAIAKQNLAKPTKEKKIKEKEIKENINLESSSPTPKEIAKDFFINLDKQLEILEELKEKGVEESFARSELNKFMMYWTEPTPNGKNQRWEKEKTFEIIRRLSTWFSNCNKFKGFNKIAVTDLGQQ
jgi:hypothetical protein